MPPARTTCWRCGGSIGILREGYCCRICKQHIIKAADRLGLRTEAPENDLPKETRPNKLWVGLGVDWDHLVRITEDTCVTQ